MRGSVLVTFDELVKDRGIDNYRIDIGPILRDVHFTNSNKLYSTFIFTGDTVTFTVFHSTDLIGDITIKRIDYTTDDEGGDNGIKEVNVIPTFQFFDDRTIATFTGSTVPSAYNFKYVIEANTIIPEPTFMSIGGGFSGSTTANPGICFDSEILISGKIIVGHRYTSYSGTPVSTITRLLNNGTLDTSFITTGITNLIQTYDIKEQSDGKLLVSSFQSSPNAFNLQRLNSDGSIDTGFTKSIFNGASSFNEERIEFQSDGKIIFGNDFGDAGLFSGYTGLMRFNTNGIIDSTFNSGGSQFSGSSNNRVDDIYVYPDNKILFAGLFNRYNGVFCNSLMRLNSDGSVDTSFTLDTTTGYTFPLFINDIEVLSNGKILVGCDPSGTNKYFNNTVGAMFRLNADGTFDSTFPFNQFSGGFNSLNDIYEMENGSLLIGGSFTGYSGNVVTNLIKLNSNGTLNTTFNPPSINGAITDIEITVDGGVLCTGGMTTLGAQTTRGIIKLDPINGSSLIT